MTNSTKLTSRIKRHFLPRSAPGPSIYAGPSSNGHGNLNGHAQAVQPPPEEEEGQSADFADDAADEPDDEEIEEANPQPVDPERQFVANLLKTPPDLATANACRVSEEWFEDQELGTAWHAIYNLVRTGEHVSPTQLVAWDKFSEAVWDEADLDALRGEADGKPVLDYARQIRERECRQILAAAAKAAGKRAAAGDTAKSVEILQKAAADVVAIKGSVATRPHLVSAKEWLKSIGKLEYLIDDILAKDQCCVIGGAKKTLKTSMAIDLAIALATGTKWLGHFQVKGKHRVAYFCGEGQMTAASKLNRILEKRSIALKGLDLHIVSAIPKLGNADALDWLKAEIVRSQAMVIFLDCLYVMTEQRVAEQAGSMFVMGNELVKLTEIAQATGTTIILLHHVPKTRTRVGEPPTLDDLSHSGVGEWARGWLLVGRRKEYSHDGRHDVYLVAGGAEHDTLAALDVDEGNKFNPDWEIEVKTGHEMIAAEKHAKAEAAAAKNPQDWMYGEMIVSHLADHPKGDSATGILKVVKGRPDKLKKTLTRLEEEGRIEKTSVKKGNINSVGYKAVPIAENTTEDESPDTH